MNDKAVLGGIQEMYRLVMRLEHLMNPAKLFLEVTNWFISKEIKLLVDCIFKYLKQFNFNNDILFIIKWTFKYRC